MMKQSTSFAQVATNLLNVLQGYSKTIRLLLVMFLTLTVSANVWGEEITYKHVFTTKPSIGNNTLSTITWGVEATNLNNYNNDYAGVQFGTSKANGSITLTSVNAWGEQANTSYTGYTNVKYVYVWLNAGSGTPTATVTIGGKAASKSGTVSKNTAANSNYENTSKLTFTPTSGGNTGVIVITASTSSKAGYIAAIEVVCETPAASCTPITPSLSYTPSSLSVGGTANPTLTGNSGNGSVTYSSSNTSVATVIANPYTVTLVPGSGSCEESVTETSAGAGVTLPEPTLDCGEWTFAGWKTTSAVATETTTKPTLIAAGAYSPTSDITLYAVYQRTEGGGGGGEASLTKMVAGNTLSDGDKIVVVANETYTAMYQGTINSSYVNKWDCSTLTADAVADDDKNWWTVTMTEGGFYLGDDTNGYLNMSSNNLYCNTNKSVWTLLDLEDGTFKLQSNGRNLSYRSDLTTNPYWRMGGTSYGTAGQTILNLYKYTSGGGSSSTTYYHSTPDCGSTEPTVCLIHENRYFYSLFF